MSYCTPGFVTLSYPFIDVIGAQNLADQQTILQAGSRSIVYGLDCTNII